MLNFTGFDNLIDYYKFSQKALNNDNIFFVGGVIRDILLNIRTNKFEDIDITLAGKPEEVYNNLDKVSGSIFKTDKFGTITIVDKENKCQFEITPFREEGTYSDNRHPDELKWTNSILLDSVRRDFTINCLYYAFLENFNIENELNYDFDDEIDFDKLLKLLKNKGYILIKTTNKFPVLIVQNQEIISKITENGEINLDIIKNLIGDFNKIHLIIDPQKGINDLINQKIRAVGNPDDRIQEDALRIIRGIRFVSILNQYDWINLDFEGKTWLAMKKFYFLLRNIAKERVIQEMKKVFKGGNAFGFIGLMDELNILKFYFPALYRCKHNDQPTRYHPFDTYSHSLLTLYHLQNISKDYLVRFGMLYHDVGKPDQYYWASIKKDEKSSQQLYKLPVVHSQIGAEYTKEDFTKLGFSKKEVEVISFYVLYHMFPGDLLSMGENKRKNEIKKFISEYGLEKLLNLCDITIGDRLGQYNPLQHSNIEGIYKLKEEILEIYNQFGRITLKDLAVNGHDIVKLLGGAGPIVGKVLDYLLELVLENPDLNKKDILLEKAENYIKALNS